MEKGKEIDMLNGQEQRPGKRVVTVHWEGNGE